MQTVTPAIDVGSRLVFWQYLDDGTMPAEDHIFTPGQFLVVAALNPDGGMQCFATDEHGEVTSLEGDTLFEEEVCHLTYAAKKNVSVS